MTTTWGPGDVVAGYRIEGQRGAGPEGALYDAANERTWKKVTLEALEGHADAEVAARFTRDASAPAGVSHRNLAAVDGAGVHEGRPWIAREPLDAESLGDRIARGPLAPGDAVGVAAQAVEALVAAHAKNVVHRALNPESLLVDRADGRVRLRGFGVATILDPTAGAPARTAGRPGSAFFLAPEQASRAGGVDARADVYGVGAILFYALSGELPYASETFGDLVRQMYSQGPRSLADVSPNTPPGLVALVDRCLRVDPSERPASADLLGRELDAALSGGALPKTVALDSESLVRGIAPTGMSPAVGAGWHPAPSAAPVVGGGQATAPMGGAPMGGGGFGQPPQGPVAPARAASSSSSSGAGVVLLIVGVVGGLGVLALTALALVGAGMGVWFARSADRAGEYVEPPPMPLPPPAPLVGAGADAERIRIEVSDTMPQRGPEDALVTIVTFSDYQCPFCARVNPTVERVLNDHPRDVRLVWRDHPLPFHTNATPAAELAREAYAQGGDPLFWRAHSMLFENQRSLERADLERFASQLGMDLQRTRSALDLHTHVAAIERDTQASETAGARGTPAFFLNGRNLMGAQPYERFDELVREELAIANQLVAQGTPRARVYEQLMRDAVTRPSADDRPAPTPARRTPDPNAIYRVPVGGSPQLGPADALVTVVIFSEFQCPFCNRVRPTLEQVRERYGSDVRLVFKHNPLPFHNEAMPAAIAAVEVQAQRGDVAFWRFHDLLFENQRELSRGTLEQLARREDVTTVGAAIDGRRHADRIEAEQVLARSLGASGTPSFFINGRNLRGAQPFPAFQAVIDEELVRARAELARGTPRAALYDALTRNGATSAQFVGEDPAPAAPAGDHYRIAPSPNAPSRGTRGAPVTIEIFSDFQCPFCGRLRPTLDEIERRYPTQVHIVWRNYPLPFHNHAALAAEAALEVHAQRGDAAFWRYHDVLFENQRDLDRPNLERFAAQLGGVDMARFRRALDSHTHQARVQADMAAVTAAGARIGTPSCFVNGELVQGAQPFAAFQAAIDRALVR